MYAARSYSFRRTWKPARTLIVFVVAVVVAVLGSAQVARSAPADPDVQPAEALAACAAPAFADGLSQSVFSTSSATWIRGEAWVQVPGVDSDLDGSPDRVHIDITRPAETADPACNYKAPVIFEASPYFANLGPNANWSVDHEVGFPPATRPAQTPFTIRNTSPIISNDFNTTWLPRGFAVVHADSLGTGWSTGCPTDGASNETLGVKAVVDWLNGRATAYTSVDGNATLPAPDWTTGKVGMMGTSYNGTLPIAAATTGVEGLEAIVPISPVVSYYDYYRTNGMTRGPGGWQGEDSDVLVDVVNTRRSAANNWQPDASACRPVVEDITAHIDRASGDYTSFWNDRNLMNDVAKIHAAVLLAHGNNDNNVMTKQAVMFYEALKRLGVPHQFFFHRGGHGGSPPDVMVNRWFTRYLYGVQNGVEDLPRSWVVREATACPPRQTSAVGDQSNTATLTVADSGQLTLGFTATIPITASNGTVSTTTRVITRIPDPTHIVLASAVATATGQRVVDGASISLVCSSANPTPYPEWPDPAAAPATLDFAAGAPAVGALTFRPGSATTETLVDDARVTAATSLNAASSNVRLLYQTPALAQDVRISGTPWLSLWVSFSKPRANLTGILIDYPPTGNGTILSRGWLDPENRNSPAKSESITPGEYNRMRFDLQPKDAVVAAGHRIGVMVLSSDFEHTIRPAPGTQLTLDLARSSVQLPIVGGAATLAAAIGAGSPAEQLDEMQAFVGGLGLPGGTANELQAKLANASREIGTPAACAALDSFLRQVFNLAGNPNPTVTFGQAEQLLSLGQVRIQLGCSDPGGSTVYLADETYLTATPIAAAVDLVELAETIEGFGLDRGVSADLTNRAWTVAKQVSGGVPGVCGSLGALVQAIAGSQLAEQQLATVNARIPRLEAELSC
jgi:predicted acyl esterase